VNRSCCWGYFRYFGVYVCVCVCVCVNLFVYVCLCVCVFVYVCVCVLVVRARYEPAARFCGDKHVLLLLLNCLGVVVLSN